jgi:hypothetical protein
MAAARPNWTFLADGPHGIVAPTSDPVDGQEVFAKFSEARSALAEWFRAMSRMYMDACVDARKIRRADVDMRLRDLEDPKAV